MESMCASCKTLSPYLFDMILDVMERGIKEKPPWCMLFADDVVCAVLEESMKKRSLRNGEEK